MTDTRELVKRLRSYAQNNEMIDQNFTESGCGLNEAADTIEFLTARLAALEADAGRFAVLPYITKEIADDFGGITYLLVSDPKQKSGYDWTQDAVDFACLIASAARSEGGKLT